MAYTVFIPTPLRPSVDNQSTVDIDGSTVGEVLSNLTSQYSELKKHLYTEEGHLRSFVNVYLNDDDIRYADGMKSTIMDGDSIQIVPSVAGGSLYS